MSRRTLISALIAAALVVATGLGFYARSASAASPGSIAVAGNVRVDEYIVRAPAIVQPVPDYSVGAPTTATIAAARKRAASAGAPSASRQPVVAGFLATMTVSQGARVTKGQVLARLDTTMLDLGVRQAETAADKASADLRVLDANLDKLEDARAKIVTARGKLLKARASLVATIAVVKKQRASLETSIAAIQALIAQPGGPPPHVPPYPVLLQGLQAGLAQLNKGLAGANAGLAKMDQGLAQMRTGLSQLDSTRRQLRNARKLLAINARASDIGVALAKARRDAATITSPVDGVVTFARVPGTAVMTGAPLVRIRPDGPAHVFTYLASEQLAQVGVGSRATVDFDSNTGGPLPGRVVLIGDRAVVPPTGFPTPLVHMTRAVRVTIELDDGRFAPPGTPVDILITTGTDR